MRRTVAAQSGWQQPGQGGQDRAVGPVRLRPGHLAAENHDLMAQHQDLRILGRLAPAQQDQPAEHADHEQVQQTDRHKRSRKIAGQATGRAAR
jgi:hypothetical protein